MKVLITGGAGFIGSAVALRLLDRGDFVISVDNLNDYYDVNLKESRLKRTRSHNNFIDLRIDIEDKDTLDSAFSEYKPDRVINLAAQAGVRYSIDNPLKYINTNLVGFGHILEACRHHNIEHLVFASSSSVYGSNSSMPYSVNDNVDHPLSLYAATKKSNELMAHTYSHLYQLPVTGLRFFTVFGPWSRPDMAMLKFAHRIMKGEPIDVYNFGKHKRDFTYIDDIVEGVVRVLDLTPAADALWDSSNPIPSSSNAPYKIYNIGNNKPEELLDYIRLLEKHLNKKASLNLLPLQKGDVIATYADISNLNNDTGYVPSTTIEAGIENFCEWFIEYYKY